MFSIDQFLTMERNHLPKGFNAKNGIRSLFPRGYSGSISALKNYVFRRVSAQLGDTQFLVGADGAGRWIFAALANFSNNSYVQGSFAFQYSNDLSGHGFAFNNGGAAFDPSNYQWVWITGVDPWISENWPQIFNEGCFFHNDAMSSGDAATNNNFGALAALGDAQQTFGYGTIFGENGEGFAEPTGFETPCTGLGVVLNGLPVSAGSDYYYYYSGSGYYRNGGADPWSGFDFFPFAISQTNGIGTGILAWTGPDASGLTGTQDIYTGWERNVIVVLLNNTRDTYLTVLTVPDIDGIGNWTVAPSSPVLPGTPVLWVTGQSSSGTQGSLQYYASRAGQPLIDNVPDPARFITFNWDNPFVGSNSYSASASPPYSVSWQGGDGDTAVVIFNLTD